ncbi:MAG: peptidylprolyl isomerase, partial [Gemmatimonadales bacterium]|nr:peptidylprolyl isomerase [Gemmatimonadales bacterium]
LDDSASARPIIDRLTGLPALDAATAGEAAGALAKIGGRPVAEFFASVLQGKVALTATNPVPARAAMLLESWRLGRDAPATALLAFTSDTVVAIRWRAVYALARLRHPAAAPALTLALRDDDPFIRSIAARALSRSFADSARIAPATLAGLVARLTDDPDPAVRVNALRSLGTFKDASFAALAATRLSDGEPNVRVQAAEALGLLGGREASRALQAALGRGNLFAIRREALLGLARSDAGAFTRSAATWRASRDWRERGAAAEGWARTRARGLPSWLDDPDPRVIVLGMQGWESEIEAADTVLVRAGRTLLTHRDGGVRSVAADAVARAADPADLPALTAALAQGSRDSFPDAAISALNGILAIRQRDPTSASRVDQEFLASSTRPADYLLRRWAEDNWPEAADRWGPAYPIATGRSLQDYRDLAATYLTAPDSQARPHVVLETVSRGNIDVELLGPEAPITVANFLRLVDQRFFDGDRWHRVVPNFVVQDGDPRGDGFGSPGGTIRDEINPVRYDKAVLGMALSGPDTGMSQWFINLSPQPHLDGTYTVFGRVTGGYGALQRISQGDVIRTIRVTRR